MNINGMAHLNINCSDLTRSRKFYEALGFKMIWQVDGPPAGPGVAEAVGFDDYDIKGGLMALEGTSVVIDLLEWTAPHDASPPYERLNHLGLARLALTTSDLDADVAELKAMSVEFVSEPASLAGPDGPPVRFVCFKDPDGTIVELVGQG